MNYLNTIYTFMYNNIINTSSIGDSMIVLAFLELGLRDSTIRYFHRMAMNMVVLGSH